MKAMHCLESCTENSSVRTGVHDKVQVIWMLMLKSAGFESVRLEDRSFDAAATDDDKDHRRPDIVCVWGGVRYIIDVTMEARQAAWFATSSQPGAVSLP